MSSIALALPAFIIYVAFIYWILVRINFKLIWQGSVDNTIQSKSNPLTQFVKRVLDFFLLVSLFICISVPLIVVVMAISENQSSTWGIDIGVFSGFKIDLSQIPDIVASGVRKPEFSGQTVVNIDTSNLFAWHFFAIVSELSALISLYTVIQLRAIVISLKNGISFTKDNAHRIKKIGMVVIVWNLLNPLLQYFGWGSIVKSISFNTSGFLLYPAFEINVLGLLIGAMLMLLSKMLLEAAVIKQEQELTI